MRGTVGGRRGCCSEGYVQLGGEGVVYIYYSEGYSRWVVRVW